ncbi:MAG TPA: flagellar biosynthesis protein FlhF [Clostridiaceae bacterium]|nr:flagellar biosynthesis protein FlhF [Clostridiaceae bacterium]
MEQEFNEIKSMLNKVYKVIKLDEDSISDIAKQYILRLRNAEVDEEIIEKLKDKIEKLTMDLQSDEDFIRNFIYNTLLDLIALENEGADTEPKKVAVFIGPTGVGKTTTMAKLAALYTLTKKKRVGFITSDTYRIAAVEQLRTYSDIIGIPLTVVYSPQEFASAVENYKDEDIIMVDTAGRSHKDKYQLMELKHLLDSDIESQVYLVISAGTKMSDCRDILNSYSFLEDYKLLFTKLDETSSYGAIINLSYITKKPLSYLTYGQSVPDDIEVADKSKIINSLLGDKLYEGSSR